MNNKIILSAFFFFAMQVGFAGEDVLELNNQEENSTELLNSIEQGDNQVQSTDNKVSVLTAIVSKLYERIKQDEEALDTMKYQLLVTNILLLIIVVDKCFGK